MLGTHDLALFVVAGLLLNITPGADTLYIVGRGAAQGRRAGVLAFLFLGVVFNVNGTLWNLLLAWMSASLARRLRPGAAGAVWLQRAAGALFVALGARLALTDA